MQFIYMYQKYKRWKKPKDIGTAIQISIKKLMCSTMLKLDLTELSEQMGAVFPFTLGIRHIGGHPKECRGTYIQLDRIPGSIGAYYIG